MDSDKFLVNLENYHKIHKIQSNNRYVTWKIKEKQTNKLYTAAILDNYFLKDDENSKILKKIIKDLTQLNHPLFSRFVGYSMTDFNGDDGLTIISEFISDQTLDDIIKFIRTKKEPEEFNETQKLKVIYSIAATLEYLQDHNILFKFIGPSSFIIDDNYLPHFSIFNFLDYFLNDKRYLDEHNMPNNDFFACIPPELADDDYCATYAAPVYSFGMILYFLFSHKDLFKKMNKFRILSNTSNGKRPELDDSIPNSYQKMIKRCFEEKESDRPTIKEIIDLLQNNREFIIDGANEDEYKEFIKRCKSKEKSDTEKVSSKEFNDLKKENEELRSKIEEYESVMLPYSHSKLEENYFVGEDDETNFESQGKIGEGATAITYKVIDKRSNAPLCKKVIKISKNQSTIKDAQNALKEFEVLHLINHPCICKAFYINTAEPIEVVNKSKKEEVTTIALYLEHLEYGLNELLNSNLINNTMKIKIVIEIAHAMNHIHKKGMMHRDLKVDNIMLNSVFQAKLVDFGLVKITECVMNGYSYVEDSLTKGIGTFSYMSPEMLNEEEYDNKTDVYSFGVFLHVMFFGQIPKQNLKDKTAGKKIALPSSSQSASKFCIDLMGKCLSPSASKRPSFEEILTEMRKNSFKLADEINPSILIQRDKELKLIEKIE